MLDTIERSLLDTSALGRPDLKSLVARRRKGYSLEAPFYTSPEVFAADLDLIFHRHWIYVGVEPDVPEPGDAMTVELGKDSIIIVRDDDNQIRAFHNVCRHRGARIVHDYKTTVGNLVCRYHQWTYKLDGELVFAEHMGPEFDLSCHALKPVHLRSLAGLLFICLAEEAPTDFDAMAAQMTPYLAPHRIADTKVAYEEDIIEPGNWKLTMENNRECYHCAGNHPELTVPLYAYGFGFAPQELDEVGRQEIDAYEAMAEGLRNQWESSGFPSRAIEHLDDMVTGFRTERLPLAGAGESHTHNTEVACTKLLGDIQERRLGGLTFHTQPNSWHHFLSDHIVTFAVIPLDAERSLLRTKWLVHKDARQGIDYDLENLKSVWNVTNAQDSELVGFCQAGARSQAYEPGPYSMHTEDMVDRFCNWYIDRMSAHLKA